MKHWELSFENACKTVLKQEKELEQARVLAQSQHANIERLKGAIQSHRAQGKHTGGIVSTTHNDVLWRVLT